MSNEERIYMENIADLRNASFKFEKPSGTGDTSFEYQGTKLILGYIIFDMLNKLCEIGDGEYEYEIQCAIELLAKKRLNFWENRNKGDSENE